jgi:hypothetical protein
MTDIFISYGHEDRLRAQVLAQTLEGQRWSIFWDRKIPIGKTWSETIGKELGNARCVIVLWSKTSIESSWVQEEADDAKQRGILLPVLIENVRPPFGFRSIQTADLADWDATEPTEAFRRLLLDIAALIGPPKEAERKEDERKRAESEAKLETKTARPKPWGKIFISYEDGAAHLLIADRLKREFGRNNVFMVERNVAQDAKYDAEEYEALIRSDVLLAVIGPNWLDDKAGVVRYAIHTALRFSVPVIPILFDGATMPPADQLPEILKGLERRNALDLRHVSFTGDMDRLVQALKTRISS